MNKPKPDQENFAIFWTVMLIIMFITAIVVTNINASRKSPVTTPTPLSK